MNYQQSDKTTWFVLGLTAISLTAGLSPGLAASSSANHPAPVSSIHSHEAMQQAPRLQPKRVVTVTGNEDWDSQRGFGKDAAMAEMMTLMMVGGSGMEHMRMAPMKRGDMQRAGMDRGAMATGAAGAADRPQRLNVSVTLSPNPPVVGDNTLDIAVTDANGKPVTGAKVTTAVAMTSMDMGTAHPQAKEGKDGHYTTEAEFSMKGPWRVTVHVAPPSQKPFTRAFDLNVAQ